MQSQHQLSIVQKQSQKLQIWLGARPTEANNSGNNALTTGNVNSANTNRNSVLLRISEQARLAVERFEAKTAQNTPSASSTEASAPVQDPDEPHLTPQLVMMRDLLERLTGVRARVFDAGTLQNQGSASNAAANAASNAAAQGNADPGYGLIYEEHHLREEAEHTQFSAQGVVRTADGKEINFQLNLDMQRYWREESSTSLRLGNAKQIDPLVINFDGQAAQLQSQRFAFDLNSDGEAENLPTLTGGRGYLALDINQNGQIDNGSELFGPGSGNGFAELAAHDDDGNGWIDENDAVYEQLRVWTPATEGAGQLQSLKQVGVGAIAVNAASTAFALRDGNNQSLGAVRASSVYLREDGGVGSVQQIDLSV